jgi:predicted phosphate transport protein (TIGR00153 family)
MNMVRKIGGIFGRKPFGPINEHMLKIGQCLEAFAEMMDAFVDGDYTKAQGLSKRVDNLESEADEIENEIKMRLSGSIFNSVERVEILNLLKAQDSLGDKANSIAKIISIRKTPIPESLKPPMKELVRQVSETCKKLALIVKSLQDYERSTPRGAPPESVTAGIKEVHDDDHAAGAMRTQLLKELFAGEADSDPVTVMMLKDIIEKLGGITGQAENAADCVGRIILLHS